MLGGHSPASARSGLSAEPGRPGLPIRARRTPQGRTRREGGKAGSRCSCEAPRRGRRGRRSQRAGPRVARAEAALRSRRGSGSGGSLTHHGPTGQCAGGPGQGPAEPPRPARAGPPGALGAAVVRDHDEVLHGCGSRPSQRTGGRRPGRRQRRRRLRFLLLRRRRRRRQPGPSPQRPRPFPPRSPPRRPLPAPPEPRPLAACGGRRAAGG